LSPIQVSRAGQLRFRNGPAGSGTRAAACRRSIVAHSSCRRCSSPSVPGSRKSARATAEHGGGARRSIHSAEAAASVIGLPRRSPTSPLDSATFSRVAHATQRYRGSRGHDALGGAAWRRNERR
jgi:hypothetical protein